MFTDRGILNSFVAAVYDHRDDQTAVIDRRYINNVQPYLSSVLSVISVVK